MSTPAVRHLLVCGRVEYDPRVPLAPYTLRNLVFRYRLPEGSSFPILAPELWLYVRIDGRGQREVWIEVVRVDHPDDPPDAASSTVVAAYGPFLIRFGRARTSLSRGWCLRCVPFPEAGWYEFRVLFGGKILAREPIYLED